MTVALFSHYGIKAQNHHELIATSRESLVLVLTGSYMNY